jgi:pimeloyl-ACP methyl ester carboxylesterase
MPEVALPQGTIRFTEDGPAGGPPVLFVHGVFAGASLWAEVVPPLAAAGLRCIAPDWPIGAHRDPFAADLSVTAMADVVAAFCSQLGLEDVTLVGNDSGGAICQHVVVRHPRRIGRVVLTNCEAFEQYPPRLLRPFIHVGARDRGARAIAALFSVRATAWPLVAPLARHTHLDRVRAWAEGIRRDPALRRTVVSFLRTVDVADSLEAGARLREFDGPALMVWGEGDPFFRPALGRRLAAAFADGRYAGIPGARCFVAWDEPGRVAGLIAEFAPGRLSAGGGIRTPTACATGT